MKRSWLLCGFFLYGVLLLSACQKQDSVLQKKEEKIRSPRPVAVRTEQVLSSPRKLSMYESPDEFLPAALPLRGGTLVVFADNPLLAPLPPALHKEILQALSSEDADRLASRFGRGANPLVLPSMTVRAGLEAGLFSRVVWVVPSMNQQEQLDLDNFKGLLKSAGLDEKSFHTAEKGTLSGTALEIPFDVVYPAALPALTGPVMVHLDLGFFVTQFKNEVKTPVMKLVGSTLVRLRETRWPVSRVTFSYSNHHGQVPLSMRPLGEVVKRLFAEPTLLDQPLPENWDLWSKTLYLENFFQYEEVLRLLTRMEKNAPNEAWVKYLRARFSRHQRDFMSADRYLVQAVAGDRGYGLEYLELSETARKEKKKGQVLTHLQSLAVVYPEDPLFQLSLCDELIAQEKFSEARLLLPKLRKLQWSEIYYPQIAPTLDYFQKLTDGSSAEK